MFDSAGDRDGAPILSQFASDPDMADLLEFFVGQMPERMRVLRESLDGGAIEDVRMLAHQLKGAGGSYGFPQITECAKRLEREADGADIDAIRRGVDELIDLCNRTTV